MIHCMATPSTFNCLKRINCTHLRSSRERAEVVVSGHVEDVFHAVEELREAEELHALAHSRLVGAVQ